MPPTVVFDTNILVSALLSLHGSPFRCLALARLGIVHSITCQEILDEFVEVLVRKLEFPPPRAQAAAAEVRSCSRLITIEHKLTVLTDDPDDNAVLECAMAGSAGYIVTGDRRHLLPLRIYKEINIISASELLALVSTA
jgi:putative PIN family toxin of toxin-antitoxin system